MGRQISANRGRSLALFLCLALLLLSFCFHHCAAAAAAAREEEEELVKAAAMADEQPKKPVPAAEEAPAAEAEAEEEEGLHLEDDQEPREHPIMGGIYDAPLNNENGFDKEDLARFAVREYNNKNNALLEFVRVVKAKEQVVSGMMHYLTVEVNDAGKKKLYEAKVWEQVWMNFRQLQEFTYLGDA
ncbi:cysteine proteinase inhibitor 1-like isoform X2 [Ananas comosus]|uniref:Cysteine proteinase inhibitor n=1 Tax=Ananas comosus TaxID=4615 RepID=C9W181_ANACO|nr:cysteine proteinase inhibitor 1-like isoform X2 [Ananas comosus]ACL14375.1 AE-rich cystatin bromelain inhibitor [Ananas comosus]